MFDATSPPPSLTCPDWCTHHQTPDDAQAEAHVAEFDGALLRFHSYDYVITPEQPHITFEGMRGEGPVSVEDLRELAAAATAAADLLEPRMASAGDAA